jgi:hypothetical protein
MNQWIQAHSEILTLAGIYLLTAVTTQLFKPRTPEEYLALPPRVAAALKTVAALGIDVPKLVEGVAELLRKAPKKDDEE